MEDRLRSLEIEVAALREKLQSILSDNVEIRVSKPAPREEPKRNKYIDRHR